MDIQQLAQQKLDEIIANGTLDKILTEQLTTTLKSIAEKVFADYSEFGKAVKGVLSEKMQLSLSKLNIDAYSIMVCNTIETIVNGTMLEGSKTAINRHLNELLKNIEKTKWKLSQIVAAYRESIYGSDSSVDLEIRRESYGIYVELGDRSMRSSTRSGAGKAREYVFHIGRQDYKIW